MVERAYGGIVVGADFYDRHLMQSLPGARWSAADQRWVMPLSWGSCQALRGAFGDRLEIGPDLWEWASAMGECIARRERLRQGDLTESHFYATLMRWRESGV